MKCAIPAANVKVLARAIHALCRIGDELYVEPEPAKISFRAVSASKSAYASFTFFESFFSYYNYEQQWSQEEDVTCKVSMKSCLAVFRSPSHLDKQVEVCQIRLEPDGVKLVFEFHCHHGIIKTHYLPIIECETLEAVYSKDMLPNRLVVQPKLLTFALSNFQLNTLELTLVVTPKKIQLRNYAEDESEIRKTVRTELCLESGEFDHYSIGVGTSITFCLREFRALLSFAEAVNLPVTANFDTGGRWNLHPSSGAQTVHTAGDGTQFHPNHDHNRPIVFVVKNAPIYESNFVFATLMSLASSRSNASQQSNENVRLMSQIEKGTASKRTASPIHARKRSIDMPLAVPGPSRGHTSVQDNNIQDTGCAQDTEDIAEEDAVPGTPPPPLSKKARHIFKRCFEATFNSQMIPGYDEVLAEDSDDESNKRT